MWAPDPWRCLQFIGINYVSDIPAFNSEKKGDYIGVHVLYLGFTWSHGSTEVKGIVWWIEREGGPSLCPPQRGCAPRLLPGSLGPLFGLIYRHIIRWSAWALFRPGGSTSSRVQRSGITVDTLHCGSKTLFSSKRVELECARRLFLDCVTSAFIVHVN